MQTQYEPELGVVVIVGSIALVAGVILVPVRQGASYGGRVFVAVLALKGVHWGITQIRGAFGASQETRNE